MAGVQRINEDTWSSTNCELPSALYFYYLCEGIEGWNSEESTAVLGNCPAIQSIQYVPFLEATDMDIGMVEYDSLRFGSLEDIRPSLTTNPFVYRINSLDVTEKTLGSFTCYNPSKSIGEERNWRNESRLYNYPYSFAMITDHLNSPLEIKYHLLKENNATVKVINSLSDRCSYGLFVDGYKNDDGKMEALVSGDAHELPCSSSAYGQWIAGNKNQINQNISNLKNSVFLQNNNLQTNKNLSLISNVAGGIASAVGGNYAGAVNSMVGIYGDSVNYDYQKKANNLDVQAQIKSNLAEAQDLKTVPNTMASMGSDVYYGLVKGNFSLDLYRFGLTEEYYNKLGDYFAMYGYKQNKVINVNVDYFYFLVHKNRRL